MNKIKRFIVYLCVMCIVITAIPVKAFAKDEESSKSTELTSLIVACSTAHQPSLVWRGSQATKIDGKDNVYYVDLSSGIIGCLRITGTRKSNTAKITIEDMTDPENKSKTNLSINYDKGYELNENNKLVENKDNNPFCSFEKSTNQSDFIKAAYGSNVFKITVEDGDKKEENYLVVSFKKSTNDLENNWPDKINILDGKTSKPLTNEYQCGNEIMAKTKGIGVCGEDGKCKIPEDTSSIRLQLEKSVTSSKNAFYEGCEDGFYRTNSYEVSFNGGPWKQTGGNEISEEFALKQGLNIVQLTTSSIEAFQEPRRKSLGGITLLLYRDGENTYEVPKGTDTSIKSVKIFQGANDKAHATDRFAELLYTNKIDEKASINLTSSNPYVYIQVETNDPAAEVFIPNSKVIDGGYFFKLDSDKNDVIPISVIPATGDIGAQALHNININWQITEASLDKLEVIGGKLTKYYKKNLKDYYLIPDSYDSNVSLNFIQGTESNIEVYLNRIDSKPIEITNNTVEVDPSKVHQVILKATSLDGITNSYTVVIKRPDSKDTSGDYEKTKGKASAILKKAIDGYKNKEKDKINGNYWDVFSMTSANESLDGYYVYDVTKHRLGQATDYAAIILQLTMIGENPYNYDGVNYVEGLKNCKDEMGSYGPFACNIWALYALDAAGCYDENLVNIVAGSAYSKNFDLDMRGWALAAIQNHLDVEGVAEKSSIAIERMKLNQDGSGTDKAAFENPYYSNSNLSSHACVIMGLTSAGINIEDEDWKVDGVSPLDVIDKRQDKENGKFTSTTYGDSYNTQVIIALGGIINRDNVWAAQVLTLDKVEKLLEKAKEIKTNPILQKQIDSQRETLEELYNKNSGNALGMGEDYYALYDLVGLADESWKPNTFMGTEEEKQEVEDVIKQIEEISNIEKLTYADKAKVEAAKSAFFRLKRVRVEGKEVGSILLQHYVNNSYILDEAIAFIENEEKLHKENAEKLTNEILKYKDVGSIKLEDKNNIMDLKQKVDGLGEEVSKWISGEIVQILNDAINRVINLEVVTPVIVEIKKLEEGVTILDGPFLKEVRAMYEALTKEQKALVKNYYLLVSSEKEFNKHQIENVVNQIKELPEPSSLKKILDGKAEEITITPKQIEQIAKAKAAYDALTPEQQVAIEAMENGEVLVTKLSEDVLIAEEYEGYIEAYLDPLVEKVKNFNIPMSANQVSYAKEIFNEYNKNESVKTYLDSIPGIKEKITSIKKGIEEWNEAFKKADSVKIYFTDATENADENLVSKDTVQGIKLALEKYEELQRNSENAASILENEMASLERLKDKIYAKKKQLNEENKVARISGKIPWDVELEIKEVEVKNYDALKSYLSKYKDASMVKAVSVNSLEIMSDGRLKQYIPEKDYIATLFTHEDFANKNVYLAMLSKDGVNILNSSVSGSDVTFTMDSSSGEYAIGVKAVKTVEPSSDDTIDGNKEGDINKNSGNKQGKATSLQPSDKGENISNSSGKTSSAPKTGDVLPQKMSIMLTLIVIGIGIFITAKKYKAANR
ncbi:hypothetical protein [Clostridium sp. UBA7503]|uniref:hypothetical protein n=1 Tax=Clostridium sp. UBA7503 TaxID=1946377 RepID=UPI0032170EFB